MNDNRDKKMIVRLTVEEHKDYKNFCDKNGYTLSKRIRMLIKNDIKSND